MNNENMPNISTLILQLHLEEDPEFKHLERERAERERKREEVKERGREGDRK
jgi:hypothetical protein